MELGSQQTLAYQDSNNNWKLYEIPNYTEQLLRCQRYFLSLSSVGVPQYGDFLAPLGNIGYLTIFTPTTFRVLPTIIQNNLSLKGSFEDGFNSNFQTFTLDILNIYGYSNYLLTVTLTNKKFIPGNIYNLFGSMLQFSADL